MHGDISSFPSKTFYNSKLLNGANVQDPCYGAYLKSSSSSSSSSQHEQLGNYCFLNIVGKEQKGSPGGFGATSPSHSTSFCNEGEARAVVLLLRSLDKSLKKAATAKEGVQRLGETGSTAAAEQHGTASACQQQQQEVKQLEHCGKGCVTVGLISPYALQVKRWLVEWFRGTAPPSSLWLCLIATLTYIERASLETMKYHKNQRTSTTHSTS
jgi:hypothetical protein